MANARCAVCRTCGNCVMQPIPRLGTCEKKLIRSGILRLHGLKTRKRLPHQTSVRCVAIGKSKDSEFRVSSRRRI